MEWVQFVVSILAGLATAIPLVVKLVEYVSKAVKERKWAEVVKLVINLMVDAEKKIESGADKKAYVLGMLKASADTIDYELTDEDYVKIADLIDSLCDMSKVLNTTTPIAVEGKKEAT